MSILTAAVISSTDNASDDNWGQRFDAAQARYRERNRKPVAKAETPAEWFERFGAELDAVEARGGLLTKLVPAECRDDSDIPTPDDDPAWDEVWTTDEPAFTDEELLRGVPMFPLEYPTRGADGYDLATSYEVGYQLGAVGFTIRDVAPPSHMSAAECDQFMAGLEAGEAKLWIEADRARTLEALYADPYREVNEAELAAAGCR